MPKKYLSFLQWSATGKTTRWGVYPANSPGVVLAEIKWYAPWRRYCLFTHDLSETTFDRNCLMEIVEFIDRLMAERKK